MKSYRQFQVTVHDHPGGRHIYVVDPGTDIKKRLTIGHDESPVAVAMNYLQGIGIRVDGLARAIRPQDVRLLTFSDAPLV